MSQNKTPDKVFSEALLITSIVITITLFAFMGEENKITGFAAADAGNLFEFDDISYLGYLPVGYYYIDNDGIVYRVNEEARKPIARLRFIEELQKDRYVYVDDYGRVGYVLEYNEK